MNSQELAGRRLLLVRVLGPAEPEVTCEECFAQLDRYVDLQLAGAEVVRPMRALRAHLDGCPACLEDYRSLRMFAAIPEEHA